MRRSADEAVSALQERTHRDRLAGDAHHEGPSCGCAVRLNRAYLGDAGTACFWTEGDALALPYGRTPLSSDERPKLANRCNVMGKVVGDPRQLARVRSGEAVRVDKA